MGAAIQRLGPGAPCGSALMSIFFWHPVSGSLDACIPPRVSLGDWSEQASGRWEVVSQPSCSLVGLLHAADGL